MEFDAASALGILYGLSELALTLAKRAKRETTEDADRGSLRLLWLVIGAAVAVSFFVSHALPGAAMGHDAVLQPIGAVVFAAGIALRWYSIAYLGRFFTVNVAIAADHRVVDTGPYRRIRHPSYSGSLMAFAGLALCIGNWVSLIAMLVPVLLVFLRRIRIEEAALGQALGERYRDYARRTKRLIPGVY
jgi:protein-S-isoprenylcysteine O-methyltransferase